MPFLVSLADVRDVVIIIYGVLGIIFLVAALAVTLVIGMTLRNLLKAARQMLDESVKPALGSVKEAADTVRGTTEFVSRAAVTPVVRAYGVAAGVKKGLSVLAGIRGRER